MTLPALVQRIGVMCLIVIALSAKGWAQETRPISTLRIGVVVGDNLNYILRRMEPFRLYLQDRLQRRVTIEGTYSFQNLMEVQASGRIHYAIYSASAYARAWANCRCVEPLAAPKSMSGGYGIKSVLLVDSATSYQSLEDLDNKRVLYTSPATLAGHLVPARAMSLLSGGERFVFADADVARDASASLRALNAGTADGVFGWEGAEGPVRGTIDAAEQSGVLEPGSTRTIWRSALLPHGPHAVLNDLPEDIIKTLRTALTDLDRDDVEPVLRVQSTGSSNSEQTRIETTYTAAEILDSVDVIYGGGFVAVDHYDYLPILNVLGWGTENEVPAWP